MRCKFCGDRLRAQDYEWDEEIKEWLESGIHRDGTCVDIKGPDHALDPSGYDYLSDFEE